MTAPAQVYLTAAELAERWHKTVNAIYIANSRGKAPARVDVGGHLLYPLAAVEAFERDRLIPA